MVLVDQGKLVPMISPHSVMAPTHLLYADDVLLFYRGTSSNFSLLSHILDHYCTMLRQLVNWSKSYIDFGKDVALACQQSILENLGIHQDTLPFSYLGSLFL